LRRNTRVALTFVACVTLALLVVFALELNATQQRSRRNITTPVHDRAVLAAALLDSLFESANRQAPAQARTYGARSIAARTLNANATHDHNAYLAVLDARSGRVLAHSRGFTAQARANLPHSVALALLRRGSPYGLGDVKPYGTTGVINFAMRLRTRSGRRILLTGFTPGTLVGLIGGELRKIPGVKGAHNYLLDGGHRVLASNNPAIPAGYLFKTPAQRRALQLSTGQRKGFYYVQVRLAGSEWRILLAAPEATLFAPINGVHKWLPWTMLAALALVALVAFLLGLRFVLTRDALRRANRELEATNVALEIRAGELARTASMALERRAAALARSNAELQRFATIASHDLQEPLRKVRTFTGQLTVIDAERLSDKGRDYAERAGAAAERMQTLIEDLLKFSQVSTQGRPFIAVDLEQVARDVLVDLEHEIERTGAQVHLARLPVVCADPLQMRQLFQNLVSNALKFHPPDVAPELRIDAALDDGTATITFRDNGIGIDPQYSERIFRIFERLHGRSAYPGTGLGLALCRKIAERHGGSVTAHPSPEGGSAFAVAIPIGSPGEVEPDETPASPAAREVTGVTA
jgi:signal transduction histidine kinase